MRALGSNKGILFLSGIIIFLYSSQYFFPELPKETNKTVKGDSKSQDITDDKAAENDKTKQDSPSPLNATSTTQVKGLKNIKKTDENNTPTATALPGDIFNEVTNQQVINELIDFLDNFEPQGKKINESKKEKNGLKYSEIIFQDGSSIKKSLENNNGYAYVYKGSDGEKFVRNFHENGNIREYMYVKKNENIVNGISYYMSGEISYRVIKNDNGVLAVTFNKDGTVKKVENKGYY